MEPQENLKQLAGNDWPTTTRRWLVVAATSSPQIFWLGFLGSPPAVSQIVPDNTLPIPSQVTVEESLHTIEGGTRAGTNLFHSFEEFSLPTGSEAFFNNATSIENILTRVTGSNISHIDGLIRANGSANLFLLNPNGLVFGPNAQLNIGGSFFGTTANSLVFENGLEFSATSPEAQPLLTVSVPVGLQFNGQPGEIQVRGLAGVEPTVPEDKGSGLQVNPGHTLAFVGGDVQLDSATLTAEAGRIELGGVGVGFVGLMAPPSPESQQWHFDYDGVSDFRDLHLDQQATVEVSGIGVGSMQLVGRQITLSDGSRGLLFNRGPQAFGDLRVQASESLTLTGRTPDRRIGSGFRQYTSGVGNSSDMEISARQFAIGEGASIFGGTQGAGNSGDINIRASESIEISGSADTISFGPGSAGDIVVSTGHLSLRGGARLASGTFGTGSAGNVLVNATEVVEAIGVNPRIFAPSAIFSISLGRGNAGSVTINTSRAIVRDGGRIASPTLASGNGGQLVINATEFVEVSGTVPGSINPSLIDASTNRLDGFLQGALRLPDVPSGSPGDVEINTPQLNVTDGGEVTVRNKGTGGAGTLQVNAEAVFLDEGGSITASTRSGEGGNISLQIDESLQLRNGSQITAEAGGSGSGGNLAISADTIALLQGSSINANAFEGQGGNIEIATRGLFLSPDSRITASSQLGVDGLVTVTEPEIDTSSALVSLSEDPIDPTTQIVSACGIARENSFVVTGNGGLPPDPTGVLRGQTVWVDTQLTEIPPSPAEAGSEERSQPEAAIEPPLVEATGWQYQEDGTVELVATPQVRVGHRGFDRSNCSARF